MSVGQRIRNRRKELKITQSELAKMINVSSQVISNWEREYTTPDLLDAQNLSYALKTTADYLLIGDYIENDLDNDLINWLEFGKQLKEEGYDLLKIQEMINQIKKTMKF